MQSYHRLHVQLGKKERHQLVAMLARGRESARVLRRALILRQLDDGQKAAQVAAHLGVAAKTVRAIARRYEEQGLESALYEKPRPGKQRVLDVGQSQRIIAMVCGSAPEGRARWSVRLIAEEAVKRKLTPQVGREDVLAIYEKPLSDKEPVVCVDEKPVVLHADVRPSRPMRPGRIARRDSEYQRRGTANVFCGVQPKAGRHFTKPTANRSSPQFADYLVEIVAGYPEADTIHLVMDNLSSHNRKALVDRFGEKVGGLLWERFTVHYTPKHGSWLNQAEIEISLFSRQCLGRRRIPSLGQLQQQAWAWDRKMNRDRVTINWQFTRKKARQKFGYNRNTFTRSET